MTRNRFPLLVILGVFAFCTLLGGCQTVEPWERGMLARPEMQLDPDPLASQLNDQVYFSKEAATGGSEAAGAGCGCN